MEIILTKEVKNYKIEEKYNPYKVKSNNSKRKLNNKNNYKNKLQLNLTVYVNSTNK